MTTKILNTENVHEGIIETCCHRVTFRYWDFNVELTDELKEDLENHAEERAKECIADLGCSSGQLNYLHVDHDGGQDEEIGGWWEIDRT